MSQADADQLKVFSGRANPQLAQRICDYLQIPLGRSLQRYPNDTWSPAPSSFGECNGAAPPVIRALTITGRTFSDPPLPVGFHGTFVSA